LEEKSKTPIGKSARLNKYHVEHIVCDGGKRLAFMMKERNAENTNIKNMPKILNGKCILNGTRLFGEKHLDVRPNISRRKAKWAGST
jgi:hypothetical protein